jgi:hypothetical protein
MKCKKKLTDRRVDAVLTRYYNEQVNRQKMPRFDPAKAHEMKKGPVRSPLLNLAYALLVTLVFVPGLVTITSVQPKYFIFSPSVSIGER